MLPNPVVVLSRSSHIVALVRSSAPDSGVTAVDCLAAVRSPEATILVDPGAVARCCLETLRQWSRQRPRRKVVYLSLPGPPETLFTLPQVHPGGVCALDEIAPLLGKARHSSPSQAAWLEIERLVASSGDDDRRKLFLDLARLPHQKRLTPEEVAGRFEVGIRQFSRLVREWFGYSPRIVFGLFRIECLARDLRLTPMHLKEMASLHGYPSPQSMSRHFQAYTGVTPGAYRFAVRNAAWRPDGGPIAGRVATGGTT